MQVRQLPPKLPPKLLPFKAEPNPQPPGYFPAGLRGWDGAIMHRISRRAKVHFERYVIPFEKMCRV